MNNNDIIKLALKNYDNASDIMKKILKLYNVLIINGTINTRSKVIFVDKVTKKTIFSIM
jgi:hypothetical protein